MFLASKIEETGRKLKDVITVVMRKATKNEKLSVDETSKEHCKWRDTILYYEQILLEFLCFDTRVEHPYHIMIRASKILDGNVYPNDLSK